MSDKKSDNNKGFFNKIKGFAAKVKGPAAFIFGATVGTIATGGIGGLVIGGLAAAYIANSDAPKRSLYALGAAAIAGGLLLGPIGAGLAVSGFMLRKPLRKLMNNLASSRNANKKQRNPNTQPHPKNNDNINVQQSKAKSLEQPELQNQKTEAEKTQNTDLQPASQLQQVLNSQSASTSVNHSLPSTQKGRNNNARNR